MFIRLTKSPTCKKTHIYLVEGYRDEDGKVKQRTIESYGYLEDLEKNDPNILTRLKQEAKQIDGSILNLKIDTSLENMQIANQLNYGYFFLEAIYNKLNISTFMKEFQNKKRFKFDIDEIVRLLVYSRILNPDSKKGTYENKDNFFDAFQDIKLEYIYKSLDYFDEMKEDFQLFLHNNIKEQYDRDCSLVFYDVTNYYFEVEYNDSDLFDEANGIVTEGLRKKGVSKEHSPNPIVQMGLLIDNKGIPIAYKLFKGNTNDKATLVPILEEIKTRYEIEKLIVVADKGLNSGGNLLYLCNKGDGYIVSQQIRKRKKEIIEKVLEENDYVYNDSKTFKIKSWIDEKEVKDEFGNIQILKEKVVCFWSKQYEDREKYKRGNIEELIQKLQDKPSLYTASNSYGVKKYLKEKHLDKTTGEVVKKKPILEFDEEKYKRDCSLDGYYMIVTSELELSNEEVIEKYRGLWRIEESFRIMKSDLEGRPVYVWTQKHIEGHFFICFLALTIMRLLQYKLDYKLTANQIQESLKQVTCQGLNKDIYIINKYDDNYNAIEFVFNVSLNKGYAKVEEIRRYKKDIVHNNQKTS